jgi:radical SAM protein with 4Fe4S-binding SPASM domain
LLRAKSRLLELILKTKDTRIDSDLWHQCRRYLDQRYGKRSVHGICSLRPCGAGRLVVALTPSGGIAVCGRALDLPGGIGILPADGPCSPGERDGPLVRFHLPQEVRSECLTCPAATICSGGCAAFLWQAPAMRDTVCYYWKGLVRCFSEQFAAIAELYRTAG